jgi:hypothetical protein
VSMGVVSPEYVVAAGKSLTAVPPATGT